MDIPFWKQQITGKGLTHNEAVAMLECAHREIDRLSNLLAIAENNHACQCVKDSDSLTAATEPRKNASRNNQKRKVRQMTAAAIRRGEIPPISDRECERCGQWAEEYHHCSYTDPDSYLDVMPLCVSCHNAVHLEQGGNETFFSVVRRSDR